MNMKAQIAILSAILTFVVITNARAQSSSIFGVYGQCSMVCRYIKINSDFTFEELLDGDLFNGQRKKGVWKFTSKTKISARGQKPSSGLHVRESESVGKTPSLTVVDMDGAVLPHARISGNADGKAFECITSEDGGCEIPKCSSVEVGWKGFKGNYVVKNHAANRFQVELTYEQIDTVIDEVWMIKGSHLYVKYEGAFDKTYSLKRVPMKTARKLFPVKSLTKP